MSTPGLGQSQRMILDALKRRGRTTIPELARELGLNIETIRDHLKGLAEHGLVRREGTRRKGPGRPEVVFGLTSEADAFFPRREGDLLRELGTYLVESGHEHILRDFFRQRIGARERAALARVRKLKGRARLNEVARIFTDLGFMATVDEVDGAPSLRLCHCPIRDLVHATRVPCVAESAFLRQLLRRRLTRTSYIPAGDASCTYQGEP